MLKPTISKLTKGKFNRYQLAIATSKCARIITDDYVAQRKQAEKTVSGNTDVDREQAELIVNREYRDKKAVKIAIDKMAAGEYVIIDTADGAISAQGGVKPAN